MMSDVVVVRLGELSLKGKNRPQFENRLIENIHQSLRPFSGVSVDKLQARVIVRLNGADPYAVIERLREVFGIASLSPAVSCDKDLSQIKSTAADLLAARQKQSGTFKVETNRADKQFPVPSQEVRREVGAHLLSSFDGLLKVDVHQPQTVVRIDIRQEEVLISCENFPGAGGLPVGTGGRVLLMLSGGIDSPVAGWMMLKRGVEIEAIHFYSPPFTSERAKQKVIDLARILTRYGGEIKLHVIPFTAIQTKIREHCPEHLTITIMRRMMMRISERVAGEHNALAIATGESLGQVASQTLESMNTINQVATIPVLRPLVALDKVEIVKIAERIGTYETSIQPYDDCCTIFVPKSPAIKPSVAGALRAEQRFDGWEALINQAVAEREVLTLTPGDRSNEFAYF